jgi:hypothetical protein
VRSASALGLAAGLVLVADLVTLAVGVSDSPSDIAHRYLSALARGDVAAAVDVSKQPKDLDRTLLGDALPVGTRLTAPKVGRIHTKGGHASVSVSYRLGTRQVDTALQLTRHGGSWSVDNGLSTMNVTGAPDDVSSVSINGVKVGLSSGGADLDVVPGIYRTSIARAFAFASSAQPVNVANEPGYISIHTLPTAAGKTAAVKAVQQALTRCFATTHELEDPCGTQTIIFVDKADFVNTDIHWRLLKQPGLVADLSDSDGAYDVVGTSPGTAIETFLATDKKHRYGPAVLTENNKVRVLLATVTFRGSVATAHLS